MDEREQIVKSIIDSKKNVFAMLEPSERMQECCWDSFNKAIRKNTPQGRRIDCEKCDNFVRVASPDDEESRIIEILRHQHLMPPTDEFDDDPGYTDLQKSIGTNFGVQAVLFKKGRGLSRWTMKKGKAWLDRN